MWFGDYTEGSQVYSAEMWDNDVAISWSYDGTYVTNYSNPQWYQNNDTGVGVSGIACTGPTSLEEYGPSNALTSVSVGEYVTFDCTSNITAGSLEDDPLQLNVYGNGNYDLSGSSQLNNEYPFFYNYLQISNS